MKSDSICFLATSKSGLGHLRRTATIARSIHEAAPWRSLHLVSNAAPDGLSAADLGLFRSIRIVEREAMATGLPKAGDLVLDTINVPGIERVRARRTIVLRECADRQVERFRLAGGRQWDLAVIANPEDHWMPPCGALPARAVTPVGWIYRVAGVRGLWPPGAQAGGHGGRCDGLRARRPVILVATGGGGTANTAMCLYAEIDALLARARGRSEQPFEVVQAIGPRAQAFGRMTEADRTVDPGARLDALFRDADLVISTAGYNSVLELATTDTPALLMPIQRSIDDQTARARLWGRRLGFGHDPTAQDDSVDWLVREIGLRRRRPPYDLGTSGEDRAAAAILALGQVEPAP